MLAPLLSLLLLLPSLIFAQTASPLLLCLQSSSVPFSSSSTPNPYNLRLPTPSPSYILSPTTVLHLQRSLACARQSNSKVSILGGGHSFVNYGYGDSGSLVISLEAFNTTSFSTSNNQLTFGGGARVGPVGTWLWQNHGRVFPQGRYGHVGLTGLATGGGFGTTARMYGMPLDNIVRARYLLANGTVVDARSGSELLWATKGAASSFGIILSLTIKTFKPSYANALAFTLWLGSDKIDDNVDTFMAVQNWALTPVASGGAPDTIALRYYIRSKTNRAQGYFYGDPTTFNSTIASLLKTLPATAKVRMDQTTYAYFDLVKKVAPDYDSPSGGTLSPKYFYTQSLTLTSAKPFTRALAYTLFNSTGYSLRPDLTNAGYLDLWGGSVVKAIKDTDTAYSHGDNLWLLRWDASPLSGNTWPSDATAYLKGMMKPVEAALVKEGRALRGFVNYRDSELSQAEWSQRLYAGNNFNRLRTLKKQLDPQGLFSNNGQSIPV